MNAVAVGQLDGRPVVVSGSHDRTVRVWDAATGTPLGDPFTGHTDYVTAVAVGQLDGRPVVVSGSHDRTVRVWDAATGTPLGDPFTGHTDWVNAVAVGQLDGRPVVVSGSHDRTVRVWDAATGTPLGDPFTGHTSYGERGGGRAARRAPRRRLRQPRPDGAGAGTRPPAPRSATRSPATPTT